MDFSRTKNSLLLFLLGISSGLPLLLVFGTLSVWLTKAGIERSTIGFLSWAGLSYGFKFIWAPLVDHLSLPLLTRLLGRRRSWLLLSQALILTALVWMSIWDPAHSAVALTGLAAGAVMLGFASATQDVVIDAYRIDIARPDQQALLAGVAVAGYRVGMVIAGAGLLEIAGLWEGTGDYVVQGWQTGYRVMAMTMILFMGLTLLIREPSPESAAGNSGIEAENPKQLAGDNGRLLLHFLMTVAAFVGLFQLLGTLFGILPSSWLAGALAFLKLPLALGIAIVFGSALSRWGVLPKATFQRVYIEPFQNFHKRYGRLTLGLLLVICFYRTSDIVMGVMAKVFYVDMGYSHQDIARIAVTFGLIMSLIGGVLGGLMALRLGVMRLLMLGAVTSAGSNLIFVYLAHLPEPDPIVLTWAIVGDNLAGGLAGGAAVAFLSSLCAKEFSAAQYAALSSITVLLPKLFAGYSGQIVDAVGYSWFFSLTALMGVPVLFLVWRVWRPYERLRLESD